MAAEEIMDIKVSIIMPSLNVEAYIRECIESVLHQTLHDIEIICVDAGSTDGTRQILAEYSRADDRITLIDSDIKSYGYQVNAGIAQAKGRYVAILETDDFVLPDMYEKLYMQAEMYSLDYAMADYKSFYDDMGKRLYNNRNVFVSTPDLYGKVLSMHDHARLYNCSDVTLWRGIYSKRFLTDNHIMLNETPGAAYQDICFMHRVRMKSRRSMYINEYGYCYRTDRDDSSINSVKGLQFARYEYQYLLEHDDIPEEYMPRVYNMMASAFVGESTNMLLKLGVWNKEDADCYEWFKNVLTAAVRANMVPLPKRSELLRKQFDILLRSKDEFTARLRGPQDNLEGLKDIVCKASTIVICGAGKRGMALLKLLKDLEFGNDDTKILCADNNRSIWNTYLDGITINSMDMCAKIHPEAYFVIANKLHGMEIKAQLLANGVKDEHIYEYKPGISWD